jgi:hypothetical protein
LQRYPQAAPLVERIEALGELRAGLEACERHRLNAQYTLLSLCSVSDSMLLATANAYGHTQVAVLVGRGKRRIIVKI